MAVGIPGDADLANPVTLERAAVAHLDRAAELAGGLAVVPGEGQGAHDAGCAARPVRAKMRPGLDARAAPPRCGSARLPRGSLGQSADIAARAGRSDVGE